MIGSGTRGHRKQIENGLTVIVLSVYGMVSTGGVRRSVAIVTIV